MRLHTSAIIGAAVLTLTALTGCNTKAAAPAHTTRDGRLSPLLSNLGSFHRAVSTKSQTAQAYFDQGLTLIYGFNHPEAVRSFREAARIDPNLGMAYWGEALAVGPNINDSATEPEREHQAYEAAQKAVARKAAATEVERGLMDAIALRFSKSDGAGRKERMEAYADAMRKLSQQFPQDPDVVTLYAAAAMDTTPWDYYTKSGEAKPAIAAAIRALEGVIQSSPDHPGAHHYFIHAVEASPNPDRAVASADKLPRLVPGAGHLVHMPAHIYIRVGRYEDASKANYAAIRADEDYITQCRAQGIYPAAYYPHNIHFLTATLAMEGRSQELFQASGKVSNQHDHSTMNQPGFGLPHLLHALPKLSLVRFGRWADILKIEKPDGSAFDQAIWHFARGMAFTSTKRLREAQIELNQLRTTAQDRELESLKIFDLNSLASLSRIAIEILDGELTAKRGNLTAGLQHLRKAVELEDGLLYSEPPDWPIPPRHNLGAALIEAGKAAEAEIIYREDLKRHRNNGWALYGLAKSLELQGRTAEAQQTWAAFRSSWKRADVQLTSSRL